MLLAGFVLRNIPGTDAVITAIQSSWSSTLRSLALTIILVKAGLELDASLLKKMKGVCIRLTAIPCLVEAVTCAIAAHLLLNFPWEWGFLLGFVLGAVTPAVIVPSLLELQDKGFGVEKGIPTLVIAASSFDDVLAISGFSVVLGITFSTGTGVMTLMVFRGPLEMAGGILIGIILGVFLWFIPSPKQKHVARTRSMLVLGFGVLALFGSRAASFPGAGALAAIVTPFVAALRWKSDKEPISRFVGSFWTVFEPIMFGLIGAEIAIEKMDGKAVAMGIAVLLICLLFRTLATFGAVSFAGLNVKEKLFVCFSWIPKATVQAAIGPVALDTAKKAGASEYFINIAEQVLTVAVLSILITAPLGAAAIGLSGPKLLDRTEEGHDSHVEGSEDEEQKDVEILPMSVVGGPTVEL
uniref:Cation/H+ exchanger transmembrane domain-containing protein n=1 Tax=Ciona savignyi TaxID=51511 RepID=H2Z5K9_CIOSA